MIPWNDVAVVSAGIALTLLVVGILSLMLED